MRCVIKIINYVVCYKGYNEVCYILRCLAQLSMKFKLLINTKMLKNKYFFCFKTLRCYIYHANKCQNGNICWHFNIYEHDKFSCSVYLSKEKVL